MPAVLRFPILEQRPSALLVVRDGRFGVVRGLLREETAFIVLDDALIEVQGLTYREAAWPLVCCAETGRSNSGLKNRLARAAKMIGAKPITAA